MDYNLLGAITFYPIHIYLDKYLKFEELRFRV